MHGTRNIKIILFWCSVSPWRWSRQIGTCQSYDKFCVKKYIILTSLHLLVLLYDFFLFTDTNNVKMYFHITHFCSTSCCLLPLCPKFVLSTLFLNTLNLCPSFDVRDVFDFRRVIKCSYLNCTSTTQVRKWNCKLIFLDIWESQVGELYGVDFLVHDAVYSDKCLPTKLYQRISNFSFTIYATGELEYFPFAQSQSRRSETNFSDNSRPQENKLCTQYTD